MTPTPEEIEKVARAMEPNTYIIFDLGYTQRNRLDTTRWLNAEKKVKATLRKARAAILALDSHREEKGLALVNQKELQDYLVSRK